MWKVTIVWSYDKSEEREFNCTKQLKTFLNFEAFCLEHGCPMPLQVVIERSE